MSDSPRKPVRKTSTRDLTLDEMAVAPGETFDLPDPTASPAKPMAETAEATGLPLPEAAQMAQQVFSPDGRLKSVVQDARPPRRISPLISGKKVAQVQKVAQAVPLTRPTVSVSRQSAARPGPRVEPGELIVQLGRFGDIINILPIAYDRWRATGRKTPIMVAREFSSVLDGVNYVRPIIFEGGYEELQLATVQAKKLDPQAKVAQVWDGKNVFPKDRDNYQRDSWHKLGYSPRWDQLPLVFDNRDEKREAELAAKIDWSKPVILLSLRAASVPFPHADRVKAAIEKEFAATYNLVDLSAVTATRIYDLLGLFDRAHVLVTCDTATLHLSEASPVPVIAFRNSNFWLGSARRANNVLNRRYSDIDMTEVVDVIKRLTPKEEPTIVKVSPLPTSDDERARCIKPENTWPIVFSNVFSYGVSGSMLPRSSTVIGDERASVYVRDMLEFGLQKTKNLQDIVIFANSDIGLTSDAAFRIKQFCAAKNAVFAYRFTHEKIDPSGVGAFANRCGFLDGGLDLFAFTRRWLLVHGGKLPDMLVGRTDWDLVYRDVIKKTGGGELYGCIWHEKHSSWWKQNPQTPGNVHNTELLKKYRLENDITRPYDR